MSLAKEPDAAGFVLAGGRSSRMGADKALIPFAGRPLVVHAIETLRSAGLAVSIAGARSKLTAFAPIVEDAEPDHGPLGGICAALASTTARWAVFLPVDLPLLPPALVAVLLAHACIAGAAVTVPSVNGFAQTFPVVIWRDARPALSNELRDGRGGCFSAFQAAASSLGRPLNVLPVECLVQCGQLSHPQGLPPARWFLNLNTPEDFRHAENLFRSSNRVI